MLEFNILKGQYLNRLDKNVVSADTTDLKAQFELTADFTGTITVWWRRSDVNNKRLDAALKELDGLKSTMKSLADRAYKLEHPEEEPEEPTEPEEPEEWPEYVQPTGAHDAYNVGDKVTYNGRHYVCVLAACVWTPDAYPQGWMTEEEYNAQQAQAEQTE